MSEQDQIRVADDVRPDWVRLVLRGRLTVSCASQMREAALAISASGKNVSVCCAGAEYLDVAAIQVLLCLGRELGGHGLQCDVTNVPEPIGEVFRLAGLGSAP
jgi:anti-anti-sigma regulatory factor